MCFGVQSRPCVMPTVSQPVNVPVWSREALNPKIKLSNQTSSSKIEIASGYCRDHKAVGHEHPVTDSPS